MTVLGEPTTDRVNEPTAPPQTWRFRPLRWALWSVFLVCWTRVLLMQRPADLVPYEPVQEHFFALSKAAHVGGYAALTILTGWLLVPRPMRWVLLAGVSAHGFLTEYLQNFVPGRHPQLSDVGLDHIGIVLGLLCSWPWWRRA
jgi:VanZ family protein